MEKRHECNGQPTNIPRCLDSGSEHPRCQGKKQLLEVIEQHVFEAEEADYEEDAETKAELDAVQVEYRQGEFMTIDEFIKSEAR